jgi:hypothetical protein
MALKPSQTAENSHWLRAMKKIPGSLLPLRNGTDRESPPQSDSFLFGASLVGMVEKSTCGATPSLLSQ